MKTILLIDDDALMRRSLAFNLEQAGYSAQTAATAEDGLRMAQLNPPDLVLLDIGLPGMDGLDGLRFFRDELKIPVIFLTARRRELDQVLGLELGADDYVTKPFDLDILLARIKAVLRRVQSGSFAASEPRVLDVGDLHLDPAAHIARIGAKDLNLSPREFDVLHALAQNAGKLVTTDNLLGSVWGAEFQGQPQVVYVHIRWLREKIESDPMRPQRIVTVRGLGYKYMPVETQHA